MRKSGNTADKKRKDAILNKFNIIISTVIFCFFETVLIDNILFYLTHSELDYFLRLFVCVLICLLL
jgi:hypothetical protein